MHAVPSFWRGLRSWPARHVCLHHSLCLLLLLLLPRKKAELE